MGLRPYAFAGDVACLVCWLVALCALAWLLIARLRSNGERNFASLCICQLLCAHVLLHTGIISAVLRRVGCANYDEPRTFRTKWDRVGGFFPDSPSQLNSWSKRPPLYVDSAF